MFSDPKVTLSDTLTIDVDGILDNDDEVSLQTPVTIPEKVEPDDFGRAIEEALNERLTVNDIIKRPKSKSPAKTKTNQMRDLKNEIQTKRRQVLTGSNMSKTKLSDSDNLSDSTATSATKTSSDSKESQNTRREDTKRKAGAKQKKRTKISSNLLNDVTNASKMPLNSKKDHDLLSGQMDDSQPNSASWDKSVENPKSAKFKKINIDELQKDMGKQIH